jgi:hypothetical protein
MSSEDLYIDGEYFKKNPTWDSGDSPWKAEYIKIILQRNKINLNTISEIGCGAGEVLINVVEKFPGSTGFGYEISPQAYSICSKKNSDRCKFILINSNDKIDCSNLLLCIDVVEHVEDCYAFLRKIKPYGDYIVFHIPLEMNVSSVLRDAMLVSRALVGHLHFFSKKTALIMLEDCGYQILDYIYTPSFKELPKRTFKSWLALIPRKICYFINQDICIKLFGGASLMVLTKVK